MKRLISLKSLVTALSRAFSAAQFELSWAQLAALQEYFHDDGTPKTLKMRLPDSANPEQITGYQAPILSLIPPKPLGIAQARMSFSVSVGELVSETTRGLTAREQFLDLGGRDMGGSSVHSEVQPIDLIVDSQPTNAASGSISIDMKVRQFEGSDGYMRMLSKLSQLQGNWDEATNQAESSADEPKDDAASADTSE